MQRVQVALFFFLSCFAFFGGGGGQAQDLQRVKVPAVGETFTVELKLNSLYVVDPFETVFSPWAEIVESCVANIDNSAPDEIGFDSQIRTLGTSPCTLKLRVTDITKGFKKMTFIRVRKRIEFDVTSKWQKVKLGKGSYAMFNGNNDVAAEIDMDKSSAGCRAAHDGGRKKSRSYGIDSYVRDGVAILDAKVSWYRILEKPCNMRLRARDGKTGKITLLKLSDKPIYYK